MREIEVKAKVKNSNDIINKIKELGCTLSEPMIQKDIIFLENGKGFPDIAEGIIALRVRDQEGKITFTLKKHKSNELDCIEREVIVDSAEQMISILELLGYHEVMRVSKKRMKCRCKEYEICLDDVEGLGSFIEVETMSDEDGEKVQKELFDFLLTLGVDKEDQVSKGYDTLLFEKGVK